MFTVDIFHKLPKIVFMPPSWPRKPNREDPAYRKLDDRMNFAVHLAILDCGFSIFLLEPTSNSHIGSLLAGWFYS